MVIKLLDAFDSRKGNCLQSAFTGLHLPDGTNSQMALIYRRSPRKIARKAPASQMQAGRCNNCLIRSGEFDIFIVAQKSLIPRVQLGGSKVAHFARQGQGQGRARCRCRCRAKANCRAGPGRTAMARARSGPGQRQLQGSLPSASLLGPSLRACPPRPCLGSAYLVGASSLGPMAW